jgi:inosine-uridine nucleoside N-ribohydrolase
MSKKLVLMDREGAVDDYLSVVLLMTMEEVETLGIIVTPADCYIQPAVSATRKILDLMGVQKFRRRRVRGGDSTHFRCYFGEIPWRAIDFPF